MSDYVLRTYLRLANKVDSGEANPAELSLLDAITSELQRNKRAWLMGLGGAL